jgi:uncharacterized protein with predicted RNA binding PUA domain
MDKPEISGKSVPPLPIDPFRKLQLTVAYFYGPSATRVIPKDSFTFDYSKSTGKIRRAYLGGKLFCTFLPNGGLALALEGARVLSKSTAFRDCCVTVSDEAKPFIAIGKSAFCKHVVKVGKNVVPALDVAVLDLQGEVVAVGKSMLSSKMIEQFKRGVAVKIRAGAGQRRHGT